MAHSKIAVTALCFLLLVTIGFGKKPHTPCEAPSKTFKGGCRIHDMRDAYRCDAACISEKYRGGDCKPVGCLCTNGCRDGEPPKREISLN